MGSLTISQQKASLPCCFEFFKALDQGQIYGLNQFQFKVNASVNFSKKSSLNETYSGNWALSVSETININDENTKITGWSNSFGFNCQFESEYSLQDSWSVSTLSTPEICIAVSQISQIVLARAFHSWLLHTYTAAGTKNWKAKTLTDVGTEHI